MAMATRRRRRRQQTLSPAADDGSTLSRWAKRKKLQDQQQQDGKVYTGPSLPEDIWCHIYSLLPLRDAARAACVSRAFRWFWRYLPNLIFSEDSLGLTRKACQKEGISISGYFANTVDHILKNHSGTCVRNLEFCLDHHSNKNHQRLNRWLPKAIMARGIQKLSLSLPWKDSMYVFPCSVLSDGKGDSIRHLRLSHCSFNPTPPGTWSSRNLVILQLSDVHVTGDGLWCLLSSSLALERLSLGECTGIACLKIPGPLSRLGYLKVTDCDDLREVESKAPNLSRFHFIGDHRRTKISLGGALRVKELHMDCSNVSLYTRAKLESITLDAKTVDMHPSKETIDEAVEISSKSAHLERLYITGIGRTPFYLNINYCALVSVFGASHSVEDFVSYVSSQLADHVSFCSTLRSAKMSARSSMQKERLVEDACCMLKSWLS